MGKASTQQVGRTFRSGYGGFQIPVARWIPQAPRAHRFVATALQRKPTAGWVSTEG